MSDRALVTMQIHGADRFLARSRDERNSWEWSDRDSAHVFSNATEARATARELGGCVVLLDQHRSVSGELGTADGGRKF